MATIARWRRRATGCFALLASSAFVCAALSYAADPDKSVDKIPTASPIKHVLIIVGENRSFDHLLTAVGTRTALSHTSAARKRAAVFTGLPR